MFLTQPGFEGTEEVAMGWWETLTAGQGTLLGAMFVVLAAVIAFSTGWLDRRIEQRRFHYNEVKAVYAEALELAYFFSAADQWSELDDKHVMAAVERLFRFRACSRSPARLTVWKCSSVTLIN